MFVIKISLDVGLKILRSLVIQIVGMHHNHIADLLFNINRDTQSISLSEKTLR